MSSFTKRVLSTFFLISKDDPEEQRKTKILNIFIFGIDFLAGLVFLTYFIFLIIGTPIDGIVHSIMILIFCLTVIFGGMIIFILNNYSSYKIAGIIFLIFITIMIYLADKPYELVSGRSLLELALPIIIACFLIKSYASYIMAIIIILTNLIICYIEDIFPSAISSLVLLLMAFIIWFYVINFEKSIEKYREAYKRGDFYRDLFAHDTRNILQSILMALEIYEQKLEELNNLPKKEELDLIKSQIDKGANLIKKVRKFGIISEAEKLLKKVDFKKVLENAIEKVKSKKIGTNIDIHIEKLSQKTFIMANNFLKDVFENILMNSVIHNDNSIIKILIRISDCQINKKNFIKIEFIDNGTGIPDLMKENIFNREIDGDKSYIGMGLGLKLVKELMESYRAKIWVENKISEDYKQGSNFILLFPEV